MELFVNGTPVGVNPAPNDTIQNLLLAVESQLEGELIISSLIIDKTYAAPDDPSVLAIPVHTVNKVELTVATRAEIGIALLEDAKNFLSAAISELKNGALDRKKEIMQTFAWIMESLDALRQSLSFPPSDIAILHGAIADILRILNTDLKIEDAFGLAQILKNFAPHFTTLQEKLANPEIHTRESVLARLEQTKNILPTLALNFQTGKDIEALSDLGFSVDTIEIYVRFAAGEKTDESLEFSLALKDISAQLLEAFENKDYVLMSDLIEYDLCEQIDAILDAVEND